MPCVYVGLWVCVEGDIPWVRPVWEVTMIKILYNIGKHKTIFIDIYTTYDIFCMKAVSPQTWEDNFCHPMQLYETKN